MHNEVWLQKLQERLLEDKALSIMLWTQKKQDDGMDWIHLAQDRDKWQAHEHSSSIKWWEFL